MADNGSDTYPQYYPLGKGTSGLKGTTRGQMVPDSAFVKLKYGPVDVMQSLWRYMSGSSNRSTADMEQRNDRCSRILQQLPLDVMLQILDHVPAADALALRASSRTLRRLLPRTINATASDRVDFYTRRHRDRYVRGCEAEQAGYLNALHLMCSVCQASHPISHFPPNERPKPPTQRRCTNAGRRIRLCPLVQLPLCFSC